MCRSVCWFVPMVSLLLFAVALGWAQGEVKMADSHLGHEGPAFQPGMKPSTLGWGQDDKAYPDKFVVNPKDGAEMVWVPAGKFRMGSTPEEIDKLWRENGWDNDWKTNAAWEQPAHEVTITGGFWLYRHEVTVGQYDKFLAATGHDRPGPWWDSYKQHPQHPVTYVTWDEAVAYSQWTGGALPTEAQWEWSARGPQGRLYPWGNQWDRSKCNSAEFWAQKPLKSEAACTQWLGGTGIEKAEDVIPFLKAVGSFPENSSWCGALDLAGNVWEWCADWYGEDYYGKSPAADPSGPAGGAQRVLRGGSWGFDANLCRSADRNWLDPTYGDIDVGFRPVVPRE